jgi:hypothetical protein
MSKKTNQNKRTPRRSTRIAELQKVSRVYNNYKNVIAQWPGVLGLGYGLKETRGRFGYQKKKKNIYAIVVVVEKKLTPEELRQRGIKPVRRTFHGVPTDVIEKKPVTLCGRERATGSGMRVVDPLVGGAAIESRRNGAVIEIGTLCLILFRDGQSRFLTCGHVAFGETPATQAPNPIYQPPGGREIGRAEDDGRLKPFVPPLDVATIVPGDQPAYPFFIYPNREMDQVAPDADSVLGKTVTKVGARTNETTGRIVRWRPDGVPGDPHHLKNLLEIVGDNGPFNDDGDSGAPVFLDRGQDLVTGVGIAVARNNPQDGHGFAHPLFLVFKPYSVGFDPIS